ncbi:deaminase, partial [Vibrio anguillarum]
VHAEMDAIVSLARSIRQSSVGMTLYSTTYPCHNCARHIVAAGILRVVYIEPYEKSLALKLHDDALTDANGTHKVVLVPFEGVSP